MDLAKFKQTTSQAGWLATGNPGCTATQGTVRYLALCCMHYCMLNLGEWGEDSDALLEGGESDDVYLQMGRAFAATTDRNMGNKYATLIIVDVLKWFSGKVVTEPQGELLKLLEDFMIASGDVRKSEEGDS